EVALHVVDEQDRTVDVHGPRCPVLGQVVGGGQRVGGDGGQGHQFSPEGSVVPRRSRLEVLPTAVAGKVSTKLTRSGILYAASPRSRRKARSSPRVGACPLGMTWA